MKTTVTADLNDLSANPNLDISSVSFKTRLELRATALVSNPSNGNYAKDPSILPTLIATTKTKHASGPNSAA